MRCKRLRVPIVHLPGSDASREGDIPVPDPSERNPCSQSLDNLKDPWQVTHQVSQSHTESWGSSPWGAALHLEIDASWWIQTFLMIHTLWIEILSCGHDSLAGHGCLQGDGPVVWSCLAHKISRSPRQLKAGLIKLKFDVSLLRSPPFSYHVACWWHTGGMLAA